MPCKTFWVTLAAWSAGICENVVKVNRQG